MKVMKCHMQCTASEDRRLRLTGACSGKLHHIRTPCGHIELCVTAGVLGACSSCGWEDGAARCSTIFMQLARGLAGRTYVYVRTYGTY